MPPIIDDRDVYRAAKLLVDRHGEDARSYASERAGSLKEGGSAEGHAVWKRIEAAVEALLSTKREGALN